MRYLVRLTNHHLGIVIRQILVWSGDFDWFQIRNVFFSWIRIWSRKYMGYGSWSGFSEMLNPDLKPIWPITVQNIINMQYKVYVEITFETTFWHIGTSICLFSYTQFLTHYAFLGSLIFPEAPTDDKIMAWGLPGKLYTQIIFGNHANKQCGIWIWLSGEAHKVFNVWRQQNVRTIVWRDEYMKKRHK